MSQRPADGRTRATQGVVSRGTVGRTRRNSSAHGPCPQAFLVRCALVIPAGPSYRSVRLAQRPHVWEATVVSGSERPARGSERQQAVWLGYLSGALLVAHFRF